MFDNELEKYLNVLNLDAPVDVREMLGAPPKKVVAVCTHRLGDTLVTLPAAQALADHFPDAQVDMLVAEGALELIRAQPFVSNVYALPFEEWAIHDLIAGYDLAILFRRWNLPAHAGLRPLCFSFNSDLLVGAPALAHVHYLEALVCLGLAPRRRAPKLALSQEFVQAARKFLKAAALPDAPLRVAVHPGSYYIGKRWFPERYAEVLAWLHRCHDAVFIVIEGRGEQELVERVTRDVPQARIARVTGRPTAEVAAILAESSFYLGNDTGILHLADAVGLPSVAIFGPSRPHVWGGAGPHAVNVVPDRVWRGCLTCSSRFLKDKPCMRPETQPCLSSIAVEEVQGAIESVLGLLGVRKKHRTLDPIRVSENAFEKKLGSDGLVVANCSGMRQLFALSGGATVTHCLDEVREHGSYAKVTRSVDSRIVDTLLAYRVVVPKDDPEPRLDEREARGRRSILAHPLVMETGRAAQPVELQGPRRRSAAAVRKKRGRARILLANAIDTLVYGGGERWMLKVGVELARRGHEVLCWGVAGHPWLSQAEDAGLVCLAGSVPETLELADVARPTERFRRLGLDAALLTQDRDILSLGLPLRMAGVKTVMARKGLPMTDDPPLVRWAHSAVMHGLIVPSRQTRDQLLGLGWLRSSQIRVIPNGVDVKRLDRAAQATDILRTDLGLPEGAKIVLSIGRLSKHKGTVHLIEAWPRIAAEHPDAVLLIVGQGPRLKHLLHTAEELGVSSQVRFLGERWDAARLLHVADCFVLPSIYEGMSTALLEAMACGLPVVATDVSGNPEVVTDGESGLLVAPADAVAIANAVCLLLGDEKLARRLGKAAREHVRRHHAFDAMVDQVEHLLLGGA